MSNYHFARMIYEQANEEKRCHFAPLSDSKGKYSELQKRYAFELIDEYGINATARILQVPLRTLQRWCRGYGIPVKRYPDWDMIGQRETAKEQTILNCHPIRARKDVRKLCCSFFKERQEIHHRYIYPKICVFALEIAYRVWSLFFYSVGKFVLVSEIRFIVPKF